MRNTRRRGMLLNVNGSILKKHKKSIYSLRGCAKEYGVPPNVLIGIYMLEVTFRSRLFRLGEYMATIVGICCNILFKIPVKNYTIGKCQVGLTSILYYHGLSEYNLHSRKVDDFNFSKFLLVLKSISFKTNSRIFADKISRYHKNIANSPSSQNLIIFIGEYYNGKLGYGLSLEKIVNDLDAIFL